MTRRNRQLKRYTLVIPVKLFNEVQSVADEQQVTIVEVLRRFIKLGLLANEIEKTTGAALVIREGDTEQQILLLW